MSRLKEKITVTLLTAVFMISIFTVAFPVIEANPLYWVKASVGGEYVDCSPKTSRCTLGLIGMSLSAEKVGVETAYKGSGVFIDHDQKIVINLDIKKGYLNLDPRTTVTFFGTARVKDIKLKQKWTGTFQLALAYLPDPLGPYVCNLLLYKEDVMEDDWSGRVSGAGEANIWVWE